MELKKMAIAVRTIEHGNEGYILYMPFGHSPNNTEQPNRYGWYPASIENTVTDMLIDADDYGRVLIITDDEKIKEPIYKELLGIPDNFLIS